MNIVSLNLFASFSFIELKSSTIVNGGNMRNEEDDTNWDKLVRGEAMEAFKRRRSKLVYRIQQHSKGSSEGSGIIPKLPDEPKDNSGSSSSSLSRSNDEV
ncbi:hypothetical protein Tco_0453779 [Tanacetum coccineum]